MNDLTDNQKLQISEIFRLYEENMNKQYEEIIKPEIELLARYKGDLAKAYHEVAGQRSTLIGCMNEILNKQDELIGLCNQLGDMAIRIERFFLDDVAPKKRENDNE
jgi:hypothetical protein